MVNIQDLIDDAKCYETVRAMRWPDGVPAPIARSDSVIKNGRDDTQPRPAALRVPGLPASASTT